MTNYEADRIERFETEARRINGLVYKLFLDVERLKTLLYAISRSYLEPTEYSLKLDLEEACRVAEQFDDLFINEFGAGITPVLGYLGEIREEIVRERDGYEPDPTFGTRNRDFAGSPIKFI